MAIGAPIVATDTGGIPEIIQHAKNGLLARPGNENDMAERITELLSQPDLAATLAHRAFLLQFALQLSGNCIAIRRILPGGYGKSKPYSSGMKLHFE